MKVWRSLAEFEPASFPILTIGNFDGVHAGHQRIFEEVRLRAQAAKGTPLALTFDPHPTRIVAPERAPRLLTPLPVKLELLEKTGIAGVLVLPFSREVSQLTPEQFARQVLADTIGARLIVVGDNFRFGHKHAGDVQTLRELGRKMSFEVDALAPVTLRGQVVSSSRIRRLLTEGNMGLANRMLTRCFSVRGKIVPGKHAGRQQTVPTLNLEPYEHQLPACGVYVTETTAITETAANGSRGISVTNVGYSPTFHVNELRVESFLLETTPPAEATHMEVFFWKRLRDELTFPSAEALRAQIMRDVSRARTFFRRLGK